MNAQPTCPQCRGTDLQPLAGSSLARCQRCRWLVKMQPDGKAETAFDPYRGKQRGRRKTKSIGGVMYEGMSQ